MPLPSAKSWAWIQEIIDSAKERISSENQRFEDVVSELETARQNLEKEYTSAHMLNQEAERIPSGEPDSTVSAWKRKRKPKSKRPGRRHAPSSSRCATRPTS